MPSSNRSNPTQNGVGSNNCPAFSHGDPILMQGKRGSISFADADWCDIRLEDGTRAECVPYSMVERRFVPVFLYPPGEGAGKNGGREFIDDYLHFKRLAIGVICLLLGAALCPFLLQYVPRLIRLPWDP